MNRNNAACAVMYTIFITTVIVGYYNAAIKTPPAPEKLTAVVKVEVESEKALNLLEMAFNQPLHDGDFQVMSTVVTVSAYTASVDECDGTPWITANGTPSRIGLLAMSKDLRTELGIWLGQTVALPPYGVFQIQDKMNKRHWRRVDILHATKKSAKVFGLKRNIILLWIPWDGKSLKVSMNRGHQ